MRLLVACFFSVFRMLLGFQMPQHSQIETHREVEDTDPFPYYTVAIEKRLHPSLVGTPHCSGVILSPNLVLTTCHQCLRDQDQVYIDGEIYVHVPYKSGEVVKRNVISAKIIIRHPNCYNHRFEYWPNSDIGLIKMAENVKLESKFFAYIPRDSFTFPMEDRVYISNFRFGNLAATTMREATWAIKVKVHRLQLCTELLNFTNPCHNFYCTGYYHIGADFCQPDIGSPLSVYFQRRNIFVTVGLLIKKAACGCHKSPALHVMTKHVREWIKAVVKHMKLKKIQIIGE